jgi:multiple sugar transport system substrate-binding protein
MASPDEKQPALPEGPRSDGWDSLSRRDFLKMAGLGLGGLVLAACGGGRAAVPGLLGGRNVQLVYQDWSTEWFPPMAQQMLEQFHSSHPNIEVFYTPDPDDLEVRMLADMKAGTAADVFQGCCNHFPTWAQKGYTLDLRSFIDDQFNADNVSDWDPAQYKALFTRDGRQFGVPKYHGALALYYNCDLFDHSDLAYPDASWTYDDYLVAMKELTRRQSN